MRRLLASLLALAAACGSPSTDTAEESSPPTGERVFPDPSAFLPPEADPARRPADAPLQTTLTATVKLVGSTADPNQIRFTFDHPVERADDTQLPRIVVTPEVPVETRWLRSDTLVVRPTTAWPAATRVEVRLDALDGRQTLAAPVSTAFIAKPLKLEGHGGSLVYPTWLSSNDRHITLWWNQPIPLPSTELVRLDVAPTRQDLVDGKTKPVKLQLAATDDPRGIRATLPRAPEVGHWYRLTVSKDVRGTGPEPLGTDFVSILRGPAPFAVTGFSCGWPACTATDTWTVNFNAEPDEKSLASCLTISPSVVKSVRRDGWSAIIEAKSLNVGTTYEVVLNRCRDTKGQLLEQPYTTQAIIETPTPHLSMVTGTGFLAPNAGPQTIAVTASHTGVLDIGLQRIAPETLAAFLKDHLEDWGGLELGDIEVATTSRIEPTQGKVGVDLTPALVDGRGLILTKVRATEHRDNHTPDERVALVQVTDLGLVVKSGPQDTLVWVTSLTDHGPRAGVTVELLTRQGESLWTATTDARGIATGPGTNVDEDDTRSGRIVVARHGADTAFLDLRRWQNRTDPYDFGLLYAWNPKSDLIRGQIFTERGVYRAGEKVFIKGFARLDRGRALEPVPTSQLRVKVQDARGNTVHTGGVALGEFGDFDLALDLSNEAPLGAWRITAEGDPAGTSPGVTISGNLVGNFRVEAYRPSTFEVKLRDMAFDGNALSAQLGGLYYSGAAMADAQVRWWVTASRASFSPKGYESFSFDGHDGDQAWWEPTETSVPVSASGQDTLDKEGRLLLTVPLRDEMKSALASGPKNLLLEAEVTDVDQQTITGRASLRVEAADAYLGVKLSTRFAGKNESVSAEVVALSPAGTPVEPKSAVLRWSKRTWSHKWEEVAGGGRQWISAYRDELLFEKPLAGLSKGPAKLDLTVSGSGTFIAEVSGRDTQGRPILARTQLYAWGDGASWSDQEGKLAIIEERPTWRIGDTARYIVQSPFPNAKALITVERSGVIERQVLDLVGSAPVIEIPVTADMAPNAYVSFALVGIARPTDTDVPPSPEMRMGYARLQVDTTDRRLQVAVAPAQTRHRPGERATVKVGLRDAANKPIGGQVTLMVVDEGVLSLTGYRTPDPHAALHVERPLSVTTSDARKSLWQRLAAEDGMKSDWGGGGEGGEPQNYRSAFSTTAAFLPRVIVPDTGEAEVSFDLPDNLTRFRVMAVAATRDGRFGSAESQIEVNKPLMVRAALPRFASVGDVFDARSVLTRLGSQDGPVSVELSVSGPLEIDEAAKKDVAVGQGSVPVAFRVKALAPGRASVRVKATSRDGETDAYEVPLVVQWPATSSRYTTTGWITGNQKREAFRLQLPDHIRADTGGMTIAVAASRINELLPSLDYLLEYPYGCVEQTTGGTLPLLALNELLGGFELPGITREAVLTRARAGLERLRTMQTWSGGLGYWPGQPNPHPWGSAYAGLAFAAAARMDGLDVPSTTLDGLKNYLHDILRGQAAAAQEEWRRDLDQVKPLAAWVLAQLGSPAVAFHAQLFEQRATLPDFGKLLLALAIDESKGERALVDTLVDDVLTRVTSDQAFARLTRQESRYYDSIMDSDLRSNALLVMALERTRPDHPLLPKLVAAMMQDRRGGHWGNTQDNAFAILALARHFVRTESAAGPSTVNVLLDGEVLLERHFDGKGFAPAAIALPMSAAMRKNGKHLEIVRQGGNGPLYWTLTLDHSPAEVPRRAVDRGLRLDRRYVFAEGPKAGEVATEIQAGDLIRVELTLESDTVQRYLAVDDPLPAGFEPVLLSLATSRGHATDDDDQWNTPIFSHTEQRDDRVNLFSDLFPKGTHTHNYLVRATTRGSFIAPAAAVHAMYSPEVAGRSDAFDVVVR